MTPLDYGSKESKQGRAYNNRTEKLCGHRRCNQNNHSVLLQTEPASISFDVKKRQRKRHYKQKQVFVQSEMAFEFHGRAVVGVEKTKIPKLSFFSRFSQLKSALLYAALDLGTSNCRLLIASPSKPGYFRVVDAFSRIVRLGESLVNNSLLNTPAMDRAIEALKICCLKLKQRHIRRYCLVATEA
ncbi:hypothetical protein HNQ69_000432 [Bartonella callosciuri]|uniref:Ppx/GppA phosphatase domain-containing protein n=1 Tax=Bartonella callosciuri TaxID=686223 RepID=A0A840NQF2_9HYPH|nr:hypothetical protein [Bartonella callosciuri]